MLFNSNEFLAFFALFCLGFWVTRQNLLLRNILLTGASFIFYGWWDFRFTGLLLFTSLLDFSVARLMDRTGNERRRRGLLLISIICNLGVLGVFKYFNFFRDSLDNLLAVLGGGTHWRGLNIILPVGISFYTFQSMSYVLDVYRRQMAASLDPLRFLAYVSFFPQLLAGPIGRGTHLLPQFSRTLSITAAEVELGIWLVIWGFFKKVVLADNAAPLVELVYRSSTRSGPMVVLGTMAFALQIYCDFSGYCDIARGLAKLLGFQLTVNFMLPYFATSLRDFWRKWHISLSAWLRDYLYIPLGGNRLGEARVCLNLGLTMLLGGLWHGASLTFVLWGLFQGLGLVATRLWEQHRPAGAMLPAWVGWLATQVFVLYGWMLFRANSLDQVMSFHRALGNLSVPRWWHAYVASLVLLGSPLLLVQAWQWRARTLDAPMNLNRWLRAALQGLMLMLIVCFWEPEAVPFIYFQF